MMHSEILFERTAPFQNGHAHSDLASLAIVAAGITATFAATLGAVWVFLLLTF